MAQAASAASTKAAIAPTMLLLRRPRQVVSTAELLPAVWRTTFVTDAVVARAFMKVRRALSSQWLAASSQGADAFWQAQVAVVSHIPQCGQHHQAHLHSANVRDAEALAAIRRSIALWLRRGNCTELPWAPLMGLANRPRRAHSCRAWPRCQYPGAMNAGRPPLRWPKATGQPR